MDYMDIYQKWVKSPFLDSKSKKTLKSINDKKEIKQMFYKELQFGTGGLRGVMGLGTNRMNIYTVAKATQGLANYLKEKYGADSSVAIAYDCRNNSYKFAQKSSQILCANGIKVYMFSQIMPTPMLSYAVVKMKCNAGIVITASHNPKEYNGFKVYDYYGGQITDKVANDIGKKIKQIREFKDVKSIDIDKARDLKLYEFINSNIIDSYIEKVKSSVLRKNMIQENYDKLKILYTPLHGTGNIPVRKALDEIGFKNVQVVKEQECPDGNFSTVKYPNPEYKEVFSIAVDKYVNENADLIIGTDPDCDRIGIMIKNKNNKYVSLNGNEVGALLTDYIISYLKDNNKINDSYTVIKSIVTTDLISQICKAQKVNIQEVLTGFKYIGEKIKEFEQNKKEKFLFGAEESYGYLFKDFVRDKDGVIGSCLISEMTLYYKLQGKTLIDALDELYKKYGYYKEKLIYMDFKEIDDIKKIDKIIDYFRYKLNDKLDKYCVTKKIDYNEGLEKDLVYNKQSTVNLPKSNVLKFYLNNETNFVIRPSGTEPKLKIYLSSKGESKQKSIEKLNSMENTIKDIIKDI